MTQDSQPSSPRDGRVPDLPLFGLPAGGASGLQGSPLEAVTGCFRDAAAWLKKEPEDDFLPAEMEAFVLIGVGLQQDGDVGRAVGKLRELNRDQGLRRRRGVVRKLSALLRRRTHATVVGGVLAMLLNQLATQRANEALEAFGREVQRLKSKADGRGPLTIDAIASRLKSRGSGLPIDLLQTLRLPRSDHYGYSQTCEACGQPAAGEMRGEGSRTLRVCHVHAQMAQKIIDEDRSFRQSIVQEHKKYLNQARKGLEECIPELIEAQSLAPDNAAIPPNLKVAREFLGQVAKALAE